jgi:hypothetical protein
VNSVSEALEDMVLCTAAVAEAADTTAVAEVALIPTHAAPMLAAVVVDLHTPTQL